MTNDEHLSITITLSPAQIDEIVRAASYSRAPSVSTLINDALRAPVRAASARTTRRREGERDGPSRGGYLQVDDSDPRLSRSLLRGLSILTCFGPDGAPRGILDLARDARHEPEHDPSLRAHARASWACSSAARDSRKYSLPGM